jgi:heavy metal translocating P-type ATPase
MKKIVRFVRAYKLFSFALLTSIVALGLNLGGLDVAAHWMLGILGVVVLLPLLYGMIQDVRDGTYGVDILAATAIGTAIIMQEYWTAAVIVLMLTGGEALEQYAGHRAKTELEALLHRAPQKAHLIRGRKEIDVKASQVVKGDKLIIRPGELVPVDAVILEGTGSFDESSLTGESLPQTKNVGDEIFSGTVNADGAITVRALRPAAESQYEQIIKLVKNATASRAPFVRLADHYAIPFTIVAFAIGIGAWVISGDSLRFLQVLVVATPCPLILAAPIAIISGMSRAAKHGIIIKNGGALEKLAQAKTFAFDKTGTLTRGELVVDGVKTFNKHTAKEIVGLAAALEQNSNHVVAQAIVKYAKEKKISIAKAKRVKEFAGLGLEAHIGGKDIVIGREQLMKDQAVTFPKGFKLNAGKQTATYISIDGNLAGIISFTDEIRTESKSTIQRLKRAGVKHLMMVTGDNKKTAEAVGKALGIKEVVSEALPSDKLHTLTGLPKNQHPTAFVGDGINDAPVLTASDVGIALGARGAAAAAESADVVIMLDDVERVAYSREIANRTFYIAKQSILVGIGLSVILMFIFATGAFAPIYGALAQEVIDIIVIINALRAHGTFSQPITSNLNLEEAAV